MTVFITFLQGFLWAAIDSRRRRRRTFLPSVLGPYIFFLMLETQLEWNETESEAVVAYPHPHFEVFFRTVVRTGAETGVLWPFKCLMLVLMQPFLLTFPPISYFRWFSMTRVEVALATGIVFSGLNTWPQDTTWQQRWVRCVLLARDPLSAVPRSALTSLAG